ncbi:MAG: cation-translocating P-type ATPase C-terminal domain-containing protein, partial [Patescibacteria group bacterium]
KHESILNNEGKFIVFAIGGISSALLVGAFLWLYYILKLDLTTVQTFVFAALGANSLLYIFSIKSLKTSIFKTHIFDNKYLLSAVGVGFSFLFASIYVPFLNTFLHTTSLSFSLISLVFAIAIIEIILIELAKWGFNHNK